MDAVVIMSTDVGMEECEEVEDEIEASKETKVEIDTSEHYCEYSNVTRHELDNKH